MDFSILARAGISQGQFAALVDVKRETVNLWTRGRFKPQRTNLPRVCRALDLLADAVNSGHLPVPREDYRARVEQRLAAIAAALHRGA